MNRQFPEQNANSQYIYEDRKMQIKLNQKYDFSPIILAKLQNLKTFSIREALGKLVLSCNTDRKTKICNFYQEFGNI